MELARLVEVTRGELVESVHLGAVAVCDSTGALLAAAGDPELATHVRSAAKPFQAIPLLAAGGAERFALSDAELALAAGSHLGEPFHVAAAAGLLEKGGFRPGDLHCGAHWPLDPEAAARLRERGEEPSALHNNCSGKHAAMLLACRLLGCDPARYWEPESPLQQRIREVVQRYLGLPPEAIGTGVDGCSVPSFHVPLRALATGYARLLEGNRGAFALDGPERAAGDRITWAMRRCPEHVRGSGSTTTVLMRLYGGRLLGKEGAEACYALALDASESERVRSALGLLPGPARAVGVALKVLDGGERARDPALVETLAQLGVLPAELPEPLAAARRPFVRNVRGDAVGELRTAFRLLRRGSVDLTP